MFSLIFFLSITEQVLYDGISEVLDVLREFKAKLEESGKKIECMEQKFNRFEEMMGSLPINPEQLKLRENIRALEDAKISLEADAEIQLREYSALKQEHDAIKQERDAIKKDRDAIKKECDAIIQMRDASERKCSELRQEYKTYYAKFKQSIRQLKKTNEDLHQKNADLKETVACQERFDY